MRNAIVWAMMAALAAAVPAMGGGTRTPPANNRNSMANRTRNILPAAPIGSGTGRIIQLEEGYSVLERTSIFDANRGRPTGPTTSTGRTPPPMPETPVFRASMFDDLGPLALMELPDGQGGTKAEYLREGETFSWDGSKVLEITTDILFLSRSSGVGGMTETEVAIGRDLSGRQIGTLPTMPGYVPQDLAGPVRSPGTGSTRLGRGRGVRGGTPGGLFSNGISNVPANAISPLGALIGSPLDPPLPPGSADDIAGRMARRRQNQLRVPMEPAPMAGPSGVR